MSILIALLSDSIIHILQGIVRHKIYKLLSIYNHHFNTVVLWTGRRIHWYDVHKKKDRQRKVCSDVKEGQDESLYLH